MIHDYFIWDCPMQYCAKNRNKINIISRPEIKFSNGDLLSSNLLMLYQHEIKKKRVSILSEGASDLSILKLRGALRHVVRGRITYLNSGQFEPSAIQKLIPLVRWTSHQDFRNVMLKLKNAGLMSCIDSILPDYFDTLYLPTDEICDEDYACYLKNQINSLPEKPKGVLIKPHPRDDRNYEAFFAYMGINSIQIPYEMQLLPAELIMESYSLRYLGGFSTAMLYYKPEKISFSMPASSRLINLYLSEYAGLIALPLIKKKVINCLSL